MRATHPELMLEAARARGDLERMIEEHLEYAERKGAEQ